MREVGFLGVVIELEGIKMKEEKVKDICAKRWGAESGNNLAVL